MISETKYRLGEFIITEHGSVLLSCVTHVALGDQRIGRCFIIGDILVIGPWDHEEAGYLKLEFHEHLMKLPAWNKTRYYCFASSVREVGSGQGITSNLIKRLLDDNAGVEAVDIAGRGAFRLGKYKITAKGNGIISWETIGGFDRTIGGTCIMESGILFLRPKEHELDEGQGKHDFFSGLKLLPRWDKTLAWGQYDSLIPCEEAEPRKFHNAFWKPEYLKARITGNMQFFRRQEFREERISKVKASGQECIRRAWDCAVELKMRSRMIFLVKTGILWGFRVLIYATWKIANLARRIINRFRRTFKG